MKGRLRHRGTDYGFEAHPLHDGRTAILISELPGSKGMSVTNAIEDLATLAAGELGILGNRLVVVERYVRSPSTGGETFDQVTLEWQGTEARDPTWERRDAVWWQTLIGRGR